MIDTAVIDRIQLARKDQSRAVFPTILNDVMVELGWTEQQAADRLDTSESTILCWMAGRNIPTWSVCEDAYQRMICGIVEQDARLINLVRERGRSLLILVNKWDGLDSYKRSQVKKDIERKFRYLGNVPVLYISATRGSGLGDIMPLVNRVYQSSQTDMGTGKLNRLLNQAVESTAPPMIGFRRIKLKYAHQGGKNPPHIIIHGNQVGKLPPTYQRYLAGIFEKGFDLQGTRVKLTFRNSRNPYSG